MARLRYPTRAALLLVALAGAGPLPRPASEPGSGAEAITGHARVADGDTLRIGTAKIRLLGIDAPEAHQRCRDAAGGSWDCGRAAAARLTALVAGRVVACAPHDRDRYGRTVATCSVDGEDLGGRLVGEGLARAYARYSDAYSAAEAGAADRGVGLWQGQAEAPWDWRRDHGARTAAVPPPPPVAAAEGCAIKGNVNAAGRRLYHLPGTRGYAATRIDPAQGERFFCDEAAALAAGWLPASGGKPAR